MNQNFALEINRRGEYVSPSLDQTLVNTEKGFCQSNVATHDGYDILYNLDGSEN